MARAVVAAVSSPDRGAALGRAARAHVLAHFRREPALERCEAYFRRVIATPARAAEVCP
jgi:hypothetical protein